MVHCKNPPLQTEEQLPWNIEEEQYTPSDSSWGQLEMDQLQNYNPEDLFLFSLSLKQLGPFVKKQIEKLQKRKKRRQIFKAAWRLKPNRQTEA